MRYTRRISLGQDGVDINLTSHLQLRTSTPENKQIIIFRPREKKTDDYSISASIYGKHTGKKGKGIATAKNLDLEI
jgi:hypothetical protein